MIDRRTTLLATVIVVFSGALWGLYWLPVRALSKMGLPGSWGTLAITVAATVLLLPYALMQARRLFTTNPLALSSIAIGGAAFALYSVGFVYGRVAIIILFYFLTPVWSTLIGRIFFGWKITRLRLLSMVMGLAGLVLMLGADDALPVPEGKGEWMALVAGFFWSIGTTGMRLKSDLEPIAAAFVFALGAAITALILAATLEPWPQNVEMEISGWMLFVTFGTGALWWCLSIAALMWATVRLEPARVGILLMIEVLIGASSAAIFAGEYLTAIEMVGGAFVLFAGVLEVLPNGKNVSKRF